MNKNVGIFCIIFLLVCVELSGCGVINQPDYITVNFEAKAGIILNDKNGNPITSKVAQGVPILIQLIKDGGETRSYTKVTDGSGDTEWVYGSFKLYKEQEIELIASAQGGFEDFSQFLPGRARLTWDQVHATTLFGGNYSWVYSVYIDMRNET